LPTSPSLRRTIFPESDSQTEITCAGASWGKRFARDVFQGEERPSVRLADFVDLHDVRVL
jgi:hypothetical protein